MRRLVLAALVVVVISGVGFAQCEPSMPVRQIIERSYLRDETGLTKAERDAKGIAILDAGVAKYPHEYYLLRARMLSEPDRAAQLRWAEAMHRKYPNRPVYELLHATAMVGKETPEAQRRLEALKKAHPEMSRVYVELADIASWGRFKDKERAQRELDDFLKLCPAAMAATSLSLVTNNGTPEQIAKTATALRRRLQGNYDPLMTRYWESLWRMEFKLRPPAEHDALRKQVAADLAGFEKSVARHDVEMLSFLQRGYESAGDKAAKDKIADEIVKDHPKSSYAKDILRERFFKDHRYPQDRDPAKLEAYWRAVLAAADEWLRLWPDDSSIINEKLSAITELRETTPEQISQTADPMLAAYRKDPNWWGMPPAEARVAEAFLKYKIRLDEVPALVEEGYKTLIAFDQRGADDDRNVTDASRRKNNAVWFALEKAGTLLDYCIATKQPEKARQVMAELASADTSDAKWKSALLERRAQATEAQGNKVDAVMLYRAAIRARTAPVRPGARDRAAEGIDRLWKELGGTADGYALLMEKPDAKAIKEASDSRWEKPKNALPSFSLSDLEGKNWKLASLQGRAVLVNLWATWCGPCRAEHPEFQKLYDKLKDRSDVLVLSLNVDDDLGKVAPYMKENQFTFPVLLGKEIAEAVMPDGISIPRNWFITRAGKLEWEQIGYLADPKWQEMILARLEDVLKQ